MQYWLFLLLSDILLTACPSAPSSDIEIEAAQIPPANSGSIVYFSFDDGATWTDKSGGLPEDVHPTDLATTDSVLLMTTKQNGVFAFDFQRNVWRHTATAPPTSSNLDVLGMDQDKILVGSQQDGIFISVDQGKSWSKQNAGLQNLTIRRIVALSDKILAGTNAGLYLWDERQDQWRLLFGNPTLQVNGIAQLEREIYIGTNQGIYKSDPQGENWKLMLPGRAVHNLAACQQSVSAMIYNELFGSIDKGQSWQSMQAGLPEKLYTFQVRAKGNALFAAQWDGVYKNDGGPAWVRCSQGLPEKFAATELIVVGNILVTTSSGRVPSGH